ncbi:VIT domain-containing protein [Caulobacter sp. NIBR1757]|uniref:VIT domain-containing protein n=1 Tax=Caulobacter sp. NIBR1757 TaxID=3016000 RepID=UPI0022F0D5A2|nr:VIT domain-containing protein [Caulobacter sp. NIBR1757]WGM40084.1 hypothetical protein AMEJIAPC_03025 [Caulobacter sp. NIBR1757]
MAWRKGWLGLAGLVLAFGIGNAAPAADAAKALNPQLSAEKLGVKGDNADLRIARMDISVEIVGAAAVTTVTATFANPGSIPLEGDFTLDLPAGSLITGYALDVNGQMRPGVLVGQRKAEQAYEATVRRRVDPGIAQVTRNNAFRTHVYPIFPGSGRTIQLTFATPLSADRPYVLPLVTGQPLGEGKIEVTARGVSPPKVTFPDSKVVNIGVSKEGRMTFATTWKAVALDGALTIADALPEQAMTVTHHSSGDDLFDIVDTAPAPKASEPPRSVRVYWDRSLSRRDDDLTRETAFLTRYLSEAKPANIELVTFASDAPVRRGFTSAAEVETALKAVRYNGATSLAGVLERAEPAADVCLLFTDGRITLDAWKAQRLRCTLVTVSTAPDADPARLSALARRSDGFHIDLAGADPAVAVGRLSSLRRVVEDITDASGEPLEAVVLRDEGGAFRIVGLAQPGEVVVKLRGGEARRYQRSVGGIADHDAAGAFWGARAVADADLNDKPDQDRLIALARRYSVATPAAAFIVLETINDYAQAGIDPPESLGKEQLAQYRSMTEGKAAMEQRRQDARLDQVIAMWDAQKVWWKAEHKPVKVKARRRDDADGPASAESAALEAPPPPPPPPAPPPPAPPPPPIAGSDDDGSVGEMVITSARREESIQDSPGGVTGGRVPAAMSRPRPPSGEPDRKVITVEVAAWNPDRPYLQALDAKGADFDTVFAEQQAKHGDLPAFYLDVAEWLFRNDRKAEAIQMALSALDMPQANTATLIIVADRMMRYGDTARGLWLYDRIAWMEPDRPQPHRNLALALIAAADQPGVSPQLRRARYEQAAGLLNKVITTPWSEAYNGIEIISLMEANALVPKLKAVGGKSPLDPRLVALLDVDIRVVLEWNTDASDMDLWVGEPSGETAKYSFPKTAIGGRMSDDMTAGFGPEEYLLRKSPNGQYEIRVHVYRPDTIDPNGSTTVRALLFRSYGRPDQTVERLEIDLAGAKEAGPRMIGKFRVGPRPAKTPAEE